MFTLVILILVSLMGGAFILSSRTGLDNFNDASLEHQAYLNADSAAQLATLISRAMFNPELGDPRKLIFEDLGLSVTLADDFNPAELLKEARAGQDIQRRYLRARNQNGTEGEYQPHLLFWRGQELLATGAVSIDPGPTLVAGLSLAESDYAQSDGASACLFLVITVIGRSSSGRSEYEAGQGASSVITTIYREVL